MLRIVKTKNELEEIVIKHLRVREASSGIASVTVAPVSGATGAWKVLTFNEGESSRGGCLLGLHGIMPILQAKFEMGL